MTSTNIFLVFGDMFPIDAWRYYSFTDAVDAVRTNANLLHICDSNMPNYYWTKKTRKLEWVDKCENLLCLLSYEYKTESNADKIYWVKRLRTNPNDIVNMTEADRACYIFRGILDIMPDEDFVQNYRK